MSCAESAQLVGGQEGRSIPAISGQRLLRTVQKPRAYQKDDEQHNDPEELLRECFIEGVSKDTAEDDYRREEGYQDEDIPRQNLNSEIGNQLQEVQDGKEEDEGPHEPPFVYGPLNEIYGHNHPAGMDNRTGNPSQEPEKYGEGLMGGIPS